MPMGAHLPPPNVRRISGLNGGIRRRAGALVLLVILGIMAPFASSLHFARAVAHAVNGVPSRIRFGRGSSFRLDQSKRPLEPELSYIRSRPDRSKNRADLS